jgi:hypothetical protein
LQPPWPDLVLACGRRSAPVARWIRERAQGGPYLVHLGRPQAPLDAFDLVVSSPQYGLPGRTNVLHNVLPLNRPQAPQDAAVAAWLPPLEGLPHPRIVLLVGGNSSSSALDAAAASSLRTQAEAYAREHGGSLLVVTSPRTPRAAADVLLGDSDVPGLRYRWRAGDPENPYAVFLAHGDEFVVTADSASMLAEAAARGRPLHFVPLPGRIEWRPAAALMRWLDRRRRRQLGERGTPKQQDRFGRWRDRLLAAGILRAPRDLAELHEALRWSGIAQPLGSSERAAERCAPDDLERTVRAVRRMLLRGRLQS